MRAWATSGVTVIDRLYGCRSRSGAVVRVQTPRIDGVRAVAALAVPVGCRSDALSARTATARIRVVDVILKNCLRQREAANALPRAFAQKFSSVSRHAKVIIFLMLHATRCWRCR